LLLQGPGETKAHTEREKTQGKEGKKERRATSTAAMETEQTQPDGEQQKGTDKRRRIR